MDYFFNCSIIKYIVLNNLQSIKSDIFNEFNVSNLKLRNPDYL